MSLTNKQILFALILLVSASFSRAGTYNMTLSSPSKVELLNFPQLNTETTVEVGENIIYRVLKGQKPAIVVPSPIVDFKVKLSFFRYPLTFVSTVLPMHATIAEGKFYIDDKSSVQVLYPSTRAGFFIPNDVTKPIEACYFSDLFANCDEIKPFAEGVEFTYGTTDFYVAESFKRELVYTGGNSKNISITYREFKNDMARPAFSQDLKYDISEDPVIGFKGARFEVIKAGNSGITLKALKYLD